MANTGVGQRRRPGSQPAQRLHGQHPAEPRPGPRRQRRHALGQRKPRSRPAALRRQVVLREERLRRLGVHLHRPGRHRLSAHGPDGQRPGALRQRRRHGYGIGWQLVAAERGGGRLLHPGRLRPDAVSQPGAWTLNGFQIGTNGNSGRNICNGPTLLQVDASLYKNIKISGRVKLQLRFEVFNLFNRTNFLGTSLTNGGSETQYNAQNVVFDTGSANHGHPDHQRAARGQLRAADRRARSADGAGGHPVDVLRQAPSRVAGTSPAARPCRSLTGAAPEALRRRASYFQACLQLRAFSPETGGVVARLFRRAIHPARSRRTARAAHRLRSASSRPKKAGLARYCSSKTSGSSAPKAASIQLWASVKPHSVTASHRGTATHAATTSR